MFDRKYKKALEVIDDEIDFYNDMFLKNVKLAEVSDDETKKLHYKRSEEYLERRIALSSLKTRILKTIGDL
jgi:hypothetical protein